MSVTIVCPAWCIIDHSDYMGDAVYHRGPEMLTAGHGLTVAFNGGAPAPLSVCRALNELPDGTVLEDGYSVDGVFMTASEVEKFARMVLEGIRAVSAA